MDTLTLIWVITILLSWIEIFILWKIDKSWEDDIFAFAMLSILPVYWVILAGFIIDSILENKNVDKDKLEEERKLKEAIKIVKNNDISVMKMLREEKLKRINRE